MEGEGVSAAERKVRVGKVNLRAPSGRKHYWGQCFFLEVRRSPRAHLCSDGQQCGGGAGHSRWGQSGAGAGLSVLLSSCLMVTLLRWEWKRGLRELPKGLKGIQDVFEEVELP